MKKYIMILALATILLCGGCSNSTDEPVDNTKNGIPVEDEISQGEEGMTLKDKLETLDEEVNPEVVEICSEFDKDVDKYVEALNAYNALTEEEQLTAFATLSVDIAHYNQLCIAMNDIYEEADENGLLTETDEVYWKKAVANTQLKVMEALANEEA